MPKWLKASAMVAALSGALLLPALAADTTQTIVFVRHGEKPPGGLGQLDCQGLNRALALPAVLAKVFGKPDAIFAPAPSDKKQDDGKAYDYVRPLATIEPTAIWFGLPIKADIGVSDIKGLEAALDRKRYRDALVFVAWEHKTIEDMVRSILSAHGGDATAVPKWAGSDFDSIYVVKIARTGDTATASFTLMHQGLDGQKETCPGA